MTTTKVFISSKMDELQRERDKVEDVINSLQMQTIRFEIFPAHPKSAADISLEEVEDSEIFVQIIGKDISEIILKEYETAYSCNAEILLFVKDVKKTQRVEEYLELLKERHTYRKFAGLDDLKQKVKYSIQSLLTTMLKRGKRKKEPKIIEESLFDQKVTLGLFAPSRKWIRGFKVEPGDRIKGIIKGDDVFSAYLLTEKDFADFEDDESFDYLDGKEETRACAIDVKAEEHDTWYMVLKDETWFGLNIGIDLNRIRSH